MYRDAWETHQSVLGGGTCATLTYASSLGQLLQKIGRGEEAEPMFRETLEKRRRVLGEDHPDTLKSWTFLANCLYHAGIIKRRIPVYRVLLDKQRCMSDPESAIV